jgi:large subunit ribosomal protein L3
MAGRMGGERSSVKNLEIVYIDIEKNLIAVKGAVPGVAGRIIEIQG